MIKKFVHLFWLIPAFFLLLTGCKRSDKPDLRGIKIKPVHIERYEVDLFRVKADSLPTEMKKLAAKYPLFIGEEYNNPASLLQMENYLNDPVIIEAYVKSTRVFPDLKTVESQLTEAFRYLKFYFPDWNPPSHVYSYISGFDIEHGIFTKDSVLVIPLDNYLGNDFQGYRSVHIPVYITRRMTPDNLVPDVIKTILIARMAEYPDDGALIEQMIAQGLLLAATEKILPEVPSHLLIGYTPEQYEWCLSNEKEMWAFLTGQNLLFSREKSVINKFVGEGPTTQGFPEGAPGRTGQFMGWQIVRAYLKNHPKENLASILNNTNFRSIFDRSGYKPPR
ncbi:MAG: hypothetical protein ACP5O2_07195 [Bacteroidales bacterium]